MRQILPAAGGKVIQHPDPMPGLDQTFHQMQDLHHLLFKVLVAVALLHVLGAAKHHFIDRNDVLKRMLPFGGVK